MQKDKILILGVRGMLGRQLMAVFGDRAVGWDRIELDITKADDMGSKIKDLKPAIIINCVAYNDVDGAEDNQDLAFKLNSESVGNLAKICQSINCVLVYYSTNYVFDGEKGEYKEDDKPNPQSVYAKSKYQGELEIQKHLNKYFVIRTAVLFGPKGESTTSKKSFVEIMLGLANRQKEIKVVSDEINSLTYAVDLANQTKLLLEGGYPFGIYHITNKGQASWYDFAREIFKIKGKNIELISVSSAEFKRKAKRSKKAVLLNTKLPQLRGWQEALEKFLSTDQ